MRKCKAILLNVKGFTLLSMMFSLLALVVFITLFSLTMSSFKPLISDAHFTKEFIIFTEQLKSEIHGATTVDTDSQKLTFTNNKDMISYSLYHNYVRRQVNGLGNDIVLLNVRDISFMVLSNGVQIRVTDEDGTMFEAIVLIFRTEGIL